MGVWGAGGAVGGLVHGTVEACARNVFHGVELSAAGALCVLRVVCCVLCVTCYVLRVTCHMSRVTSSAHSLVARRFSDDRIPVT